jgi:hypothetical protein
MVRPKEKTTRQGFLAGAAAKTRLEQSRREFPYEGSGDSGGARLRGIRANFDRPPAPRRE